MMIFLSTITILLGLAAALLATYAHLRIFNRPYFGRQNTAQPLTTTKLTHSHIFVKHLEGRHWWEFWLGSWIVRHFCVDSPETRARKTYAKLYMPENTASVLCPLVVYTHGNGAIVEEAAAWLEHLVEAGYALLVCEYRGFGEAGGHPERKLINRDLCFFYDEAIKTGLFDTTNITFYGRSLGGGIACDLASQKPVQRLILESTYYKLREITGSKHIPDFMLRGKDFECANVVKKFNGDVLICHGFEDSVSPVAQAHKLMSIKPSATLQLFHANHSNIYQLPEYQTAILAFLNQKKRGSQKH